MWESQNSDEIPGTPIRLRRECAVDACENQNRFIDCPVRSRANRLKNFFSTDGHREHQIVYVKADLLKIAGRMPGAVVI